MKPGAEAAPGMRWFARAVVRRTREAWLPRAAGSQQPLNGSEMEETKRVSDESGAGCRAASARSFWGSVFIALAVVAAVLAGELWAARAVPVLDAPAARQIVGDVSAAVSRVAEVTLVGPVD